MRAGIKLMLGLGVTAGATGAPPADAQSTVSDRLDARRTTEAREVRVRADAPVTTGELYVQTGLVSAGMALGGGATGMLVDDRVCESRHGDEPSLFLGPCFFYTGAATKVGWMGGAVGGATYWAARSARTRGCPARAAWWRALGGALVGAVPGAVVAARGDRGQGVVAFTPLLSSLGAVSAVAGCRGRRYASSGA